MLNLTFRDKTPRSGESSGNSNSSTRYYTSNSSAAPEHWTESAPSCEKRAAGNYCAKARSAGLSSRNYYGFALCMCAFPGTFCLRGALKGSWLSYYARTPNLLLLRQIISCELEWMLGIVHGIVASAKFTKSCSTRVKLEHGIFVSYNC